MAQDRVTLSAEGCVRGALMCLPAVPSFMALGMVFGTLAAQKGLSFLETLLINSFVFAGASQFVAMEVYREPLTWGLVMVMIGVTAAVNMRMFLMGASLRPWLGDVPRWQTYPALYLLTDLTWIISLSEHAKGNKDWGIYLGNGLATWAIWSISVIPGYFIGGLLSNPKAFGLDVLLPAFFTALLVPLWKDKRQTYSWIIAGLIATVTWWAFGGYWGIFTGAIAGAFAGAYLDE